MALTRNFKQTVVERVEHDPEFTRALLDEAATLLQSGETEILRLMLCDLASQEWNGFNERFGSFADEHSTL